MNAPAPTAKTWGPFTGRQLTTMIVALMIGVIFLPSAVWAVDTFSNVAIEDPVSGTKAGVDASHHLLTNGTVAGSVSAIPRPPSTPWNLSIDVPRDTPVVLAGPSATPLNLTALSIAFKADGTADFYLFPFSVPSTATTCDSTNGLGTAYHLPGLPSSAGAFAESFPTPLQVRPPSGQKVCLYAYNGAAATVTVNASGYFGG